MSNLEHPRDSDSRRLIWGVLTICGLVALGYAGWLGIAVTNLQQQVAGITAKLDIVIHDPSHEVRRP